MNLYRRTLKALAVCCLLASISLHANPTAAQPQTDNQAVGGKNKMKWFTDAKFGMFITWGLYSVPGGSWKGKPLNSAYGEWIEWSLPIPHSEYAAIAQTWNPKQFDADEWVKTAREAGMKYLLITAKFHDGFLMYPSKITHYNIIDCTPWKRDPVKELSEACARQGLKFGVYWNQAFDWQNPNALTPNPKDDAGRDFDKYINEVSLPQLRELLVTHPLISFIWFDQARGTPEMTPERAQKFVDLIHSINPDIIFNSRLGGGGGDYTSMGDNEIPVSAPHGLSWESAGTMNHTWGYKAQDTDFSSAEVLLRKLILITSLGGNYLLDVGPTGDGQIPTPELDRLRVIGDWLKVNGEAIYGTSPGPFQRSFSWGRATQKPGKLYLSVFDWPKDGYLRVPLTNSGVSAYLLSQPDRKLTVDYNADGLRIAVPPDAPDKIASVIVLNLHEPAKVSYSVLTQSNGGILELKAEDADLKGTSMRLEKTPVDIGYWTNRSDTATWSVRVVKPGIFNVDFDYALDRGSKGSEVILSAGNNSISFKPAVTSGWTDYRTASAGTLRIDHRGRLQINLKAAQVPGDAVMGLRSITLTPAP
jgi:alpha-L-fucosidase